MKLITAEVRRALLTHPLYSQESAGLSAKVLVKFFGGRACTWLVTEAEPRGDDWLFYGAVNLGWGFERGYFMFSDVAGFRSSWGLPAERDLGVPPGRFTLADLVASEGGWMPGGAGFVIA